jgi:hypothetical protein
VDLKTIKESLEKIAPSAYRSFPKGEGVPPPFICYFINNENVSGADDKNYIRDSFLIVELYTNKKDPETEGKLDAIFNGYEFEKYEAWIEDEGLLQIAFHLQITEKL